MNSSGIQICSSRSSAILKVTSRLKSKGSSSYFTVYRLSDCTSFATTGFKKVEKAQNTDDVNANFTNRLFQNRLLANQHSNTFGRNMNVEYDHLPVLQKEGQLDVRKLEGQFSSNDAILNPTSISALINGLCDDLSAKMLDRRLISFFRTYLPECTVEDVTALFQAFKHLHSITDLKYYMPLLALHLETLSSSSWSYRDLSYVINGLQYIDPKNVGFEGMVDIIAIITTATAERKDAALKSDVLRAMEVMTQIHFNIRNSSKLISSITNMMNDCDDQFDAEAVRRTMGHFKSMEMTCPEFNDLLHAVGRKIKQCTDPLTAEDVSVCLSSIQHIKSDSTGVLCVLGALTPLIAHCRPPYANSHTASTLFSLQNMSSSQVVVRSLLKALSTMLSHCQEPFNSNETGIALYGLRNMNSEEPHVLKVLRLLVPFVSSGEPLEARSMGDAFYGLKGMNSCRIEVCRLIEALVPRIEGSKGGIAAEHLSKLFHGMQNMNSCHDAVKALLLALVPVMLRSTGPYTPAMTANMLYGLKGMNADLYHVREMLFVLRPLLLKCNGVMNPTQISFSLFGMQNMGDYDEVSGVLAVLSAHLQESSDTFGCEETGRALYGLKGSTSVCSEVRKLLSLLAPKLRSTIPLDAKGVFDSINGLMNMSSEHDEVCDVIEALVPRIKDCGDKLDGYQVARVLYCLQSMGSERAAVRSLLAAIPHVIDLQRYSSVPYLFGSAMYGLQGMKGEHAEVLDLMSLLMPPMLQQIEHLSTNNIGCIVYGLQGMYSTQTEHLNVIERNISETIDLVSMSDDHFQGLCQNIMICMPMLRAALHDSAFERWDALAHRIRSEIRRRDIRKCLYSTGTKVERRVAHNANIVAANSSILVAVNQFSGGLFECDISLSMPLIPHPSTESRFLVLNLEVDGYHHMTVKRIRFGALRDAYLASVGVLTRRKRVEQLIRMGDGAIQNWIKESLADAALHLGPLTSDDTIRFPVP